MAKITWDSVSAWIDDASDATQTAADVAEDLDTIWDTVQGSGSGGSISPDAIISGLDTGASAASAIQFVQDNAGLILGVAAAVGGIWYLRR